MNSKSTVIYNKKFLLNLIEQQINLIEQSQYDKNILYKSKKFRYNMKLINNLLRKGVLKKTGGIKIFRTHFFLIRLCSFLLKCLAVICIYILWYPDIIRKREFAHHGTYILNSFQQMLLNISSVALVLLMVVGVLFYFRYKKYGVKIRRRELKTPKILAYRHFLIDLKNEMKLYSPS